jgi:hypothetical protein
MLRCDAAVDAVLWRNRREPEPTQGGPPDRKGRPSKTLAAVGPRMPCGCLASASGNAWPAPHAREERDPRRNVSPIRDPDYDSVVIVIFDEDFKLTEGSSFSAKSLKTSSCTVSTSTDGSSRSRKRFATIRALRPWSCLIPRSVCTASAANSVNTVSPSKTAVGSRLRWFRTSWVRSRSAPVYASAISGSPDVSVGR